MICRVFLIIWSIKCFEIEQYHRVEKLYEKASILFQFSYWAILAPLLPFFMEQFSGGGRKSWRKFVSQKLSSARTTIKNSFGTLKAGFRCIQNAMVIKPFVYSDEKWSNMLLESCDVQIARFLKYVWLVIFYQYAQESKYKHPPTSHIFLLCITLLL